MTLRLYNTRTKQKEIFEPLDRQAVRMYVCGPTVYDFAHIGNARALIPFDVLFRLLRQPGAALQRPPGEAQPALRLLSGNYGASHYSLAWPTAYITVLRLPC